MARQRELIRRWAEENGHEVVAWAEDVDVSGTVSPFKAPELGPFLTDDGKEDWDILVAWKLDRLARNAVNMHELFIWVQKNDKKLVCVSENINLDGWVGRMIASVIAGVAEGELEAISERITAGRKALRESGRWQGGTRPLGYTPVRRKDGGWELVKHPEEQKLLQWIFQQALEGRTFTQIADELNARKEPTVAQRRNPETKTAGVWKAQSVKQILRNPTFLGWTMHKGRPVLDENGEPILKSEPAISIDVFNRVQAILDSRETKIIQQRGAFLAGIIECFDCGSRMHIHRGPRETSDSYRCAKNCGARGVNSIEVEKRLSEQFKEEIWDKPIMRRKPGAGNSAQELEEARKAYDEIAQFLSSAPSSSARQALFDQLSVAGARVERLEKECAGPAGLLYEETGETYGQRWDSLDKEGKRAMLIASGIRLKAKQLTRGNMWGPGILQTEIVFPTA